MPLIRYQIGNMFIIPNENSSLVKDVSKAKPYTTALMYIGSLAASLLISLQQERSGSELYLAIGLYVLPFLIFCITRMLMLRMMGAIFFSTDKTRLADMERRFYMAMQAVIMIMLAVACVMYSMSVTKAILIALCALIFTEIVAFCKEIGIFFKKNVVFSHFFLYLCTLEAIPLALLIGMMAFLTNTL